MQATSQELKTPPTVPPVESTEKAAAPMPLTYENPYKNMKRPSFATTPAQSSVPATGQGTNMVTPFQKYKEQSLSTLAPGELLVRLYDEMIKQMRFAVLAIEKQNMEGANNALLKCQTILSTLESSLDTKYELSENLRELYIFMAKQLMNANVKKDTALIEECVPLVRDLRDAFDQAEKESRKTHATAVGGNVG